MEKTEAKQKLSYEELENVARQLSAQAQQLDEQNKQLRSMLSQANLTNLYKRLDYLFKVTQEENKYLSEAFREQCGKEIESLMTPPSEEESDNTGTEEGE